jgi:hypothetical protein
MLVSRNLLLPDQRDSGTGGNSERCARSVPRRPPSRTQCISSTGPLAAVLSTLGAIEQGPWRER